MMRVLVGILTAFLAVGLVATEAQAGPKKKKARAKKEKGAPTSEVIAKTMEEAKLTWGMGRIDLQKHFLEALKEKYRPIIAKTHDAVEEDRLRRKAREEMDKIKKGYVEFSGSTTGWDVSFLKGEFAQNNGESMVVVRDENSQNFYFFVNDQLWKWYKAFDASAFPRGGFPVFASAVQRKFGEGKEMKGELRPGDDERHWVEWQDAKTRLRAVDQTDFYGFYCLVFEDKAVANEQAKLHASAGEGKKGNKHALVESVTSGDDADPDDSPNVADRITGRMRKIEQAPEDTGSGGGGKRRGSSSSSSSSSSESSGGVRDDDDPLKGLGL